MWNPALNWKAQSSFEQPVTPPSDEPDAAPLVCVSFNAQWVPYVLASLMQLTQPAAWDASPSAVLTVLDQATRLIELFITGVDCVSALEFRFTEACTLQVSTDGGDTWTDVPGWSTFASTCFTGPTGPTGDTGATGATGATGNTPELRWNGCTFQVSLDLGVTWTDLSGFDIAVLQGCLGGTPATPPGTTLLQMACNIANWLAVEILQASMSSLATSIGTTATTLEAALSLFGLAASFSGVSTLFFEAAGIFIAVGTAIGETALNTAAGDTGLRTDLTCAIFLAIEADGSVTPTNFAAVLTAINGISYGTPGIVGLIHDYVANLGYAGIAAIQGEGSLYGGSCSTCGVFCYHWDLTTALGAWTFPFGSGNDGHWVSGTGIVADNDSGDWWLEIDITFSATFVTELEGTFTMPVPMRTGTGGSFVHYLLGGTLVRNTALGWINTSAPQNFADAWAGDTIDEMRIRLRTVGVAGAATILSELTSRGDGTNPFGTTNCV